MKNQKLTTKEMREIVKGVTEVNFETNVLPRLEELKYTNQQKGEVFADMFANAMQLFYLLNAEPL